MLMVISAVATITTFPAQCIHGRHDIIAMSASPTADDEHAETDAYCQSEQHQDVESQPCGLNIL